jgi:hypothetical protein
MWGRMSDFLSPNLVVFAATIAAAFLSFYLATGRVRKQAIAKPDQIALAKSILRILCIFVGSGAGNFTGVDLDVCR